MITEDSECFLSRFSEYVTADIERVESELEVRNKLPRLREEISDEIETLRTHIERTEREAIDRFNDHTETILYMLGYAIYDGSDVFRS